MGEYTEQRPRVPFDAEQGGPVVRVRGFALMGSVHVQRKGPPGESLRKRLGLAGPDGASRPLRGTGHAAKNLVRRKRLVGQRWATLRVNAPSVGRGPARSAARSRPSQLCPVTRRRCRMARSTLRVSLVAALSVTALAACARRRTTGLRKLRGGQRRRHRDVGRRPRRHGRAGQGGQEGGRAQRHRAAAGLGQLRQHHQGLPGQVPSIKVTSAQPDAASQDEINAAKSLKGTDRAPDVFDLGQSVALANTAMFAPYKVATWDDIPDEFKDADGTWVNDYGGYMSIGYDSSEGARRHRPRRPARARSSRARSRSTVTRRRPVPRSAA